jgi:CBS domain-containing protein
VIIRSVKQILAGRALPSVRPHISVREACGVIDRLNVGAMVVLDGERLVGILSERDVIRKCICRARRTDETLVADIMTPDPKTIGTECCLADALALMKAGNFRHVPVLENDRTVGLLSIRDIPTEYRLMLERFHQYRAEDPTAPADQAVRRADVPRPHAAAAILTA